MAKISQERKAEEGGGASSPSDSSSAKTRDTAGVLAGRSFKRKTLWLTPLGGTIVGCLSAEQHEMPPIVEAFLKIEHHRYIHPLQDKYSKVQSEGVLLSELFALYQYRACL